MSSAGHGGEFERLPQSDAPQGIGVEAAWWDVAVPEVSSRAEVALARAAYDVARGR
jgi:TPP-dependent trihydroxycyclohexane-1,2-dione (THcHDO) dehydratase